MKTKQEIKQKISDLMMERCSLNDGAARSNEALLEMRMLNWVLDFTKSSVEPQDTRRKNYPDQV